MTLQAVQNDEDVLRAALRTAHAARAVAIARGDDVQKSIERARGFLHQVEEKIAEHEAKARQSHDERTSTLRHYAEEGRPLPTFARRIDDSDDYADLIASKKSSFDLLTQLSVERDEWSAKILEADAAIQTAAREMLIAHVSELAETLRALEFRAASIRATILGAATIRDTRTNAMWPLPAAVITLLRAEPLCAQANTGTHGSPAAVQNFRTAFDALCRDPEADVTVDHVIVKPTGGPRWIMPEHGGRWEDRPKTAFRPAPEGEAMEAQE